MKEHVGQWSIEEMAKALSVSRSGYYQSIKSNLSRREQANERLLKKIRAIHQASREVYGSPRIHAQLQIQGELCTSYVFQQDLVLNNMLCSMSGTGNCYDNAAMESFFHTLKTEHVYFESYKTREQAKKSIFEYVEVFYNRKRSHSTLGFWKYLTMLLKISM